jgi:uncharacterized protein
MLAERIGFPQLRDMAGRSERVVADIELAELERIADLLNPDSADLSAGNGSGYRLTVEAGFVDHGRGFPELEARITGKLPLNCQRCLHLLEWDVDCTFSLAILETEADLERVDDNFDTVLTDEHGFCLVDTVTDELLGSLPIAPVHQQRADCPVADEYMQTAGDESSAAVSDTKLNRPFAGLAALVGRDDQDGNSDNN